MLADQDGSSETASETLLVGVGSAHSKLLEDAVGQEKESKLGWVERQRHKKRLKRERSGPSLEAAHEQRKMSKEYDAEKSAKIGEQMLGGGGG